MGLTAILVILGALLVSLILWSFLTWLASKVVARDTATFGRAVQTTLLRVLAGVGLGVFSFVLTPLAGGDPTRTSLVALGLLVLSIAIHILIPARVYVITAWNAFALNVLTVFFGVFFAAIPVLLMIAIVGLGSVKNTYAASLNQAQQLQLTHALPTAPFLSSVSPPPPAPPDYATEIDSMLNSALHPVAGHPTLAEREDVVRLLQPKLKAQKSNLPSGDAHAALVFQNQLNRYMDLLNQVKAERKLHPLQEGVAGRNPMPAVGEQGR